MTLYRSVIAGTGSYLPERRLTNADLEKLVVTSDEWIVTRTGISERRIAAEDEATSDMAYAAAAAALASSGLSAADLDLIVVATETPDYPFPPVATQLQARLGCGPIAAFDVHLVCTGFVAALHTADALLRSGAYRHALVVGADKLSPFTDYSDRTTCILFSDGAGAVVLRREEASGARGRGLWHAALHSDGRQTEAAILPGGGSRHPVPGTAGRRLPPQAPAGGAEPPEPARPGEAGAEAGLRGHDAAGAGSGRSADAGLMEAAESPVRPSADTGHTGSPAPDDTAERTKPFIIMDGRRVFRLAVPAMSATVESTLQVCGLPLEQLDWLIPHQANQRILDAVARQIGLPEERVISTIQWYGNNSAATIPIALDTAVKDGRIRTGHRVMLTAFGGGAAWGSALLEM